MSDLLSDNDLQDLSVADYEVVQEVLAHEELVVEVARHDPAVFADYVLRDEHGKPVLSQPFHTEWQHLWNTTQELKAGGHRNVLIWGFVESAKTQQLCVARPLWELGQDVNLRQVVISCVGGLSSDITQVCGDYIEKSREFQKVFPHVRRDKNKPWNTSELYVQRSAPSLDPSINSTGLHGNILGSRIDRLYYDDILTYEVTRTPERRLDTAKWCKSTLEGRLTKHARCLAVGNAWHREDYYHELAARPEFSAFKYPILKADGTSRWPERWPMERINAFRSKGVFEFNRQLMCRSLDDAEARCKKEWVDLCLENGSTRKGMAHRLNPPRGFKTFTGVDLSVGKSRTADLTAVFTLVLHPNGDYEPLALESGRWAGDKIIATAADHMQRYNSTAWVENNAGQDFLLQELKRTHPALAKRVHAFTTTAQNKHDRSFGVESVFVDFANGRWIIPSKDGRALTPELEELLRECLYYDPNGHTGDRLMAAWIAREAARQSLPVARTGTIRLKRH